MDFWKYLHPLLKTDNDSRYSTANYAVLKSLADSLSDAESDTLSKKIQLIFETATGDYLDEYGKWFGVSRYPKEDDDDYRERIKYYLLIPRSTVKGIIAGIQYYLNDTKAQISIYEPWKNIFYLNKSNLNGEDHLQGYYYRYAVIDVHIDRPMSKAIHDAIEAFKPAGVKFYVTVDGNLGEDVKRLILADFKVTRLDTINRMFGFNYARILPFTFADRKDTLVPNTDYFKTNNSELNGADVLAGSPTHNVTYWNSLDLSNSPYKDMPVNLLTGTSDQETSGTIPANNWTVPSQHPNISVTPGQNFVYQIFITNDNTVDLHIGVDAFSGTTWKTHFLGNVIKAGTYGYSSVMFTIPSGVDSITASGASLMNLVPTATTVYWSEEKLELGTTASPWSPNPADPEYGSTPEQRAVLSTNNSTYLTLPATKYKDVPVNMLTGTAASKSYYGTNYAINPIAYVEVPIPGTSYSFSVNSDNSDHAILIEAWAVDADGNRKLRLGSNTIGPNSRGSINFMWPLSGVDGVVKIRIDAAWTNEKDSGSYILSHEKLEIGTTASPWSPNPADPEYYENMVDGTLSLYNQLVNNYSSIVNIYSGSTNYEKVVSMLKDSNIAIQEKVVSDKAVLINGIAPNKDGIIDIDKSKISYTGSDITVPLVVTSNDACRISYAAAGIYIRLFLPGMGTNLKSDQLETNIKKA